MRNLVQFHAENKFLLMSYNQKELSVLGKVVANHERKQLKDVFKKHEIHLYSAFENPARKPSNLNVIMHALGYFSKKVSLVERRFFLNSLEEYKRTSAVEYTSQKSYFQPYPISLLEVTDFW